MGRFWERPYGLKFAVGIEDTFTPQTYHGRRALDEYELTGHYEKCVRIWTWRHLREPR